MEAVVALSTLLPSKVYYTTEQLGSFDNLEGVRT